MDIKIIYEDSSLLVVDKPSGVTVNRSDTTEDEETLQDFSEKYLKIPNSKSLPRRQAGQILNKSQIQNLNTQNNLELGVLDLEFARRGGIVHRLDKETSGIMLIAKNPASFLNLQSQFKERIIKKTYIALVHGEVKPESGEINVPVGRLSFNRKRFGIVAGGREAVTKYRVLSIKYYAVPAGRQVSDGKKEALSLLELYPKTGRTHQIRVHLKYFGHPVFSDPLYGGRKTSRNDRKLLPRLFLHATEISFFHPRNGKKISFKSPLPHELVNFLLTLSEVSI